MSDPIVVEYAITLTQPWASLMALGAKQIETRGRRTNFRGWIAIHAAKGYPNECRALCRTNPFHEALLDNLVDPDSLPTGVVVAVTRVVHCLTTAELLVLSKLPERAQVDALHAFGVHTLRGVTERERAFGNYDWGRFGYLTTDVRRLRDPMPMRGSQTIPWRMPRAITEEDLI